MEPSKFSCSLCTIPFTNELIPFILPCCEHYFCFSCVQKQTNPAQNHDANFICILDDKTCKNPLSEIKIAPFFQNLSKDHQLKVICDKHPNNEIEFKCLTDFVFLCSLCLLEHNQTHPKEKLSLIGDLNVVEEKLIQMKTKINSYLEKAKTIKVSNSSKSNELLQFFKSSTNIIKSPFCSQFNEKEDVFPLNFSPLKTYDLVKISKIAEYLNDQEIEFIENIFLPKHIQKLTLLYRASQNQFSAKKFHDHCDSKGPNLTLIKSKTGRVFGAFSTTSWMHEEKGHYYSASGSFLFSVHGQKKFDLLNQFDSYSIYSYFQYGPTFGSGYDIYLSDCCDRNSASYSNLGSSFKVDRKMFERNSWEARSYLANSYYFSVEEYEVFSIELKS